MQEKIEVYVKGLILSFMAVVIFAAFEWIQVGAEFNRFFSLFIVATIFWTITYFTRILIATFLLLLASFTMGFGALFGFGIIAYMLIKVTVYILPSSVATFTSDDLHMFVIGAYYCISVWILTDGESTTKKTVANSDVRSKISKK